MLEVTIKITLTEIEAKRGLEKALRIISDQLNELDGASSITIRPSETKKTEKPNIMMYQSIQDSLLSKGILQNAR